MRRTGREKWKRQKYVRTTEITHTGWSSLIYGRKIHHITFIAEQLRYEDTNEHATSWKLSPTGDFSQKFQFLSTCTLMIIEFANRLPWLIRNRRSTLSSLIPWIRMVNSECQMLKFHTFWNFEKQIDEKCPEVNISIPQFLVWQAWWSYRDYVRVIFKKLFIIFSCKVGDIKMKLTRLTKKEPHRNTHKRTIEYKD